MTNRPSRSLVSSPTVPVRPASRPRASGFGREREPLGGLDDALPGGVLDLVAAVERLRGRRDGDAGEARDVGERDRAGGSVRATDLPPRGSLDLFVIEL